ncbi:MAG TPA: hypothetical protein VIO64_00635 [Pseudobacteroides sp.]|uniref:hypothetical protein n=1 Tax=Pseudobacteroides sp. TaxID=1968840 RepID=UPI002F94DAA5
MPDTGYNSTEVLEVLIGGCIGFVAVIGLIIFFILRYKVKIEQIKADAMVKAEEVRAKNQLEIERMLMQERHNSYYDNFKSNSLQDEICNDNEMIQNRHNERKRI